MLHLVANFLVNIDPYRTQIQISPLCFLETSLSSM